MTGYLVNFSIYTMAMIGVIFIALFVFKFVSGTGSFSKKSGFLNIEDSLNLSARKTLFVIRAGEQRFLVASDIDRTALISPLEEKSLTTEPNIRQDRSSELPTFDGVESIRDMASIIDFKKARKSKGPVMKELAEKLKAMQGSN
ncbi:MAG TPA: flagellar biosynthetic protein FliO [Candidatus Gastranaerophilaceae bacterium]|nr:flagellar biosynthetic protein FliO [Candidatus Gastranaerophilaceae bacterium]HPT41722.1 flagellar biosynthetic protein FliO [Candidatus Gastranaerophilaceae bacterium]